MHTPRLVVAALAAGWVLVGCSAAPDPEPTIASPTVAIPATPTTTPTPTPKPDALIPGTELKAGPEPGTALGPTGKVLRFVPVSPTWSPTCRPLTADERDAMRKDAREANTTIDAAKGDPVAVDLPEAGWAVVAYWATWPSGETHESALVRGGGSSSGIGTGWAGSHTLGSAAFADGPKALRAAHECLGIA